MRLLGFVRFALITDLCAACSQNTATDRHDTVGGGPMVYARTMLRALEESRYASLIVGLSTIEVLDVESNRTESIGHPQSDCIGFPIALAVRDINNDGSLDLLMMDPSCGNWIAPAGEKSSMWSGLLPQVDVARNLLVADVDGDHISEVVLSEAGSLTILRERADWWDKYAYGFDNGLEVNALISGPIAIPYLDASGTSTGVLLQRGRSGLAFVPLDRASDDYVRSPQALLERPAEYLKPFEQFDHLTAYSEEECSAFALGIGIFDSVAGAVPRRIQLLFRDGNSFEGRNLGTTIAPSTFTLAHDVLQYRTLVISIEDGGAGGDYLEIGSLGSCGTYESLFVHEVDFNWRTVDAPPYYTADRLEKTNGIELVATGGATGLKVLHYDGFVLRTFDWDGIMLTSAIDSIHETRSDVVY